MVINFNNSIGSLSNSKQECQHSEVEKLFHRIVLHDSVHHADSQSHYFVEVEFRDLIQEPCFSKPDKVVNLTTSCHTPFTISQIRHGLGILLLRPSSFTHDPESTNFHLKNSLPPPAPLTAFSLETLPLFLFLWNRSFKISSNRCTRFKPPPLATFPLQDHYQGKPPLQI